MVNNKEIEKIDIKELVQESPKMDKNNSLDTSVDINLLSKLIDQKENYNKNHNKMDLRDVLERLNEIESGYFDLKLESYIKLRKDIEKQIC